MREHPDFIARLDFLAEVDGKIVGSIINTKSVVVNELVNKLGMLSNGSISMRLEYQHKGSARH